MNTRRAVGWMADAACVDRLDLPWITDTSAMPAREVRAMRAVCDGCPVRVACTAYVATAAVTGGTWAGIDRDPAIVTSNRPTRSRRTAVVQDPLPGVDDLLGGVA